MLARSRFLRASGNGTASQHSSRCQDCVCVDRHSRHSNDKAYERPSPTVKPPDDNGIKTFQSPLFQRSLFQLSSEPYACAQKSSNTAAGSGESTKRCVRRMPMKSFFGSEYAEVPNPPSQPNRPGTIQGLSPWAYTAMQKPQLLCPPKNISAPVFCSGVS